MVKTADDKLEYTMASIVASINIAQALDLEKLSDYLSVSNYSGQPHFLAFRYHGLRPTVLMHKSGTITFAGAKDFSQINSLKETLLAKLRSFGIILPSKIPLKVNNIVAVCNVEKQIDIEGLFTKLRTLKVLYDPEIFPALFVRKPKSKVVILLYSNGRIVVTGAKSIPELTEALEEIHNLI